MKRGSKTWLGKEDTEIRRRKALWSQSTHFPEAAAVPKSVWTNKSYDPIMVDTLLLHKDEFIKAKNVGEIKGFYLFFSKRKVYKLN